MTIFVSEETGEAKSEFWDRFIAASTVKRKAVVELNFKKTEGEERQRLEEASAKEWRTIRDANAVRIIDKERSSQLEQAWAARREGEDLGFDISDSRMIHTNKLEETGARAKARWCVAGYQESNLKHLVETRETDAPTPGQDSKGVALLTIVARRWVMNIGDITGTFFHTEPIQRTIYVRAPKGETLEGLEEGQLVLLLVSVYGLNTAPLGMVLSHDWGAEEDRVLSVQVLSVPVVALGKGQEAPQRRPPLPCGRCAHGGKQQQRVPKGHR